MVYNSNVRETVLRAVYDNSLRATLQNVAAATHGRVYDEVYAFVVSAIDREVFYTAIDTLRDITRDSSSIYLERGE